ncbi:MAG TPA: GDP-L-fucose synthase [bacterium]|nr:GDP-L-fucose synthase [bacterium]
MNKNDRIYVAGHTGLVGSGMVRALTAGGYGRVVTRDIAELDLTSQQTTDAFFTAERPDYVFLCAARVGGIMANCTYPAQFIYDNIMIAANVIHASYRCGVKKLLNLGSSCIYPRLAPQPLKEDCLLTGELEPTNEPYAIAKIAAIKLCRYFNTQYGTNFISVMPTNLFGPHDNFDLETSHVMPALIRRFHEAREQGAASVRLWGTGKPMREFLHVDDLAGACIHLMERYDASEVGEFVNIGTGKDMTIRELAQLVSEVVGYRGAIEWDASKPDGTPRKLLDVSKIHGLGWKARIGLKEGIRDAYAWFLDQNKAVKG